MIRVLIEMWPGGDKDKRRTIGEVRIGNDSADLPNVSNYNVGLIKLAPGGDPNNQTSITQGRVEGFPRTELDAFDLLYRALHATVGERNKGLDKPRPRTIDSGEIPHGAD